MILAKLVNLLKEYCKLVVITRADSESCIDKYICDVVVTCADTAEDVQMCIEKGADLITANDPVPLLTVLGRL